MDTGLPSYEPRRARPATRGAGAAGGSVHANYAELERDYGETMSAEVMDAVTHALRLTEEERDHLIRLARPDRNHTPPVAPPPQRLRPASK